MSFARTSCACPDCAAHCRRQPGPLAPGDLEAIAAHLGETPVQARRWFVASPGATVLTRAGCLVRVGTITPARTAGGACVFLTPAGRCAVHRVAPFGCRMFDNHQSPAESHRRAAHLVSLQATAEYQALRGALAPASTME